jgi:hypothetical protein
MDHTAPNGAKGNYFRILRINGICAPGEATPRWEVLVGFYASQDVRAQNTNPLWQYQVNVPFYALTTDPRQGPSSKGFYDLIKEYDIFAGQNILDVAEDSGDITTDTAKATKIFEINNARLVANTTSFPYMGKEIACDALSRSDIDGVNGYIALMGAFPPGWVGKWKTVDNAYIQIESLDDWKAFYTAMVNQGQNNFLYAQWLKQQVANAADTNSVSAIYWGMPMPQAT